ncbi:MAG: DUF3159 domain-containing protein [Actinomycetota bacterium]|nr:DUF3159 domain-containing protein [Actinomycetota bacterium]
MPDRPRPGKAGEVTSGTFVDAVGGGRGLLDSALPATVFVLVRLVTGDLGPAIAVALATGVALLLFRRSRGEPLQQVGSGFFGLVIAVLVARATGKGEGFFLPGILTTALTGVFFVGSLLLGKPAVALALEAYDAEYAGWREHPGLRRACTVATAVWAATFFVRAGVATYVYRLQGDNDGLLLVVVNAVKWPLIVGAAVLTVVLVRRSGYRPPLAEPSGPTQPAP